MDQKSTKIFLYPVIIEPCEEGGYFAYCPSLQGCHTEGESYSETIENIEDVIKGHIEIRKKNKEFIPSIIVKGKEKIGINLPILIKM